MLCDQRVSNRKRIRKSLSTHFIVQTSFLPGLENNVNSLVIKSGLFYTKLYTIWIVFKAFVSKHFPFKVVAYI